MRDSVILTIISLCGIVAYVISVFYPPFDSLFLALIFGIFAGSFFDESCKRVVEKYLSIILPIGIAMYGANIKINPNIATKFTLIAILSAFTLGIMVYLISKKVFKLNDKLSALISCGTAICGASAIAIVSPLVKPKKEEFSAAIIIITIVGLTSAIVLPFLYYLLSIPSDKYALLCGATLHQTALVEIATRPLGNDVVKWALEVKGVRIALIAVVAFLMSVIYSKHRYYVPWYIAAFLIVSYFSSFVLAEDVLRFLRPISTIAFSITLASVGFSVNVRDIQNMRIEPLIAAYTGWICAFLIIFALVMI